MARQVLIFGKTCTAVLIMLIAELVKAAEPLHPVAHCKQYSDQNTDECVRCEERYWLRPANPKSITEKASCQPCVTGCLQCENGLTCLRCDDSHTQRVNSTCDLCDSNCVTCGALPSVCLTCPRFSSLDRNTSTCSWTFRIILGLLALIAIVLLAVVTAILCRGKKKKGKKKVKHLTENILGDDEKFGYDTKAQAQYISSVDMIGMGFNQTNLSEVGKENDEPYSHTEDLGSLMKNSLGGRKRSIY